MHDCVRACVRKGNLKHQEVKFTCVIWLPSAAPKWSLMSWKLDLKLTSLSHVTSCTLSLLLSPVMKSELLNNDLSWVTLGKELSALRPWEIVCCAMGAASACLRGPHVVIVVAVFNLSKFLTEMELQVVWVWSCGGEGHLASISMCQAALTKPIGHGQHILETRAATHAYYDFIHLF